MKISHKYSLGKFFTFELSKFQPVHGWFWYKEGFASELVQYCIDDFSKTRKSEPKIILDPFCGTGTTLLSAKAAGIRSIGIDASPLAVFIAQTKCDEYFERDLEAVEEFITNKKTAPISTRWEFELFDPRAAFPKRNYNEILALRAGIEEVENPRARNLLLLALLSVLPQASLILKDGGVLKIRKDRKAAPAKEIFTRKVKSMIRELRNRAINGPNQSAYLGDARALDIANETIDLVITSPPYLNNIDYSKIYGLELSLLSMSKSEAEIMRMLAIRSFIGRDMNVGSEAMPPEVGEIGEKIQIIGTYFKDMEAAIIEMYRVLRPGGVAYVNVSNSVIHETHVLVDEVFAEMAERIGFSEVEIIVGAERIADIKPSKVKTRESVIVMRKD